MARIMYQHETTTRDKEAPQRARQASLWCPPSLTSTDQKPGDSRAMTILRSTTRITTDPALAIYGRHEVEGTRELVRHDVDVYRITYATRDTDGGEIIASGAILVPRKIERPRLMCYCRGTIIPGSGEHI